MFQNARLKLTAWYLLIIMTISISFSIIIYRGLSAEVERSLRMQRVRIERSRLGLSVPTPDGNFFAPALHIETLPSDPEVLAEATQRILYILIMINSAILVVSALAGYFLAGKTLQPIEEMVEDQKRFIADASHELRTPLTSMKTEIEVSLREKKVSAPEYRALLKSNLEEINKLSSLSNYLLNLNRYQNTEDQAFKEIQLSEIIEKSIARVQPHAIKKDISLTKDLEDITLLAQPLAIEELIIIFLDNAIKYSNNSSTVKIRTYKTKSKAVITIADQGIGIKASDLPFIFNRFYRADTSRSKMSNEGYGLGLSIAKSIITMYKGSVTVESTPNKGTTFTISLPLLQS